MIRPLGWNVCVASQEPAWISTQALALLQPAHWLDWCYNPHIDHHGHVPMVYAPGNVNSLVVWLKMRGEEAGTVLLYNEPERPEQAKASPTVARRMTQEYLMYAWATDAEFQWCAPSVTVNMTDFDGLAWLTEYTQQLRRRGLSRPTYWGVHLYASDTVAQLRAGWDRWRAWHETWGSDAPTIITEVCASGAPLASQMAVMDECREMLFRGDVAGVFWFLAYTNRAHYQNANLVDVDYDEQVVNLNHLGELWRSLA